MLALVNFESASSRVLFVAAGFRAHEGFLSRVRQDVRLQVALGDEVLLAVGAAEGPFASVRAHVGLQVARLGELF